MNPLSALSIAALRELPLLDECECSRLMALSLEAEFPLGVVVVVVMAVAAVGDGARTMELVSGEGSVKEEGEGEGEGEGQLDESLGTKGRGRPSLCASLGLSDSAALIDDSEGAPSDLNGDKPKDEYIDELGGEVVVAPKSCSHPRFGSTSWAALLVLLILLIRLGKELLEPAPKKVREEMVAPLLDVAPWSSSLMSASSSADGVL